MEYRRFGNTIVARIDQGEDVLEKMKRIAMLEDVKLASVSALGTFSSMTVGIYDLEKRQFMGNDFEGMFENRLLYRNHQHDGRKVLQPHPCGGSRCEGQCVRRTFKSWHYRSDLRDGDYGD